MVDSIIFVKGHGNKILQIETDRDKFTTKDDTKDYQVIHGKELDAPSGYCILSRPSPFYTTSMAGVEVSKLQYDNGNWDPEITFHE